MPSEPDRSVTPEQYYSDKLIRLVPAEFVTVFLAIKNVIDSQKDLESPWKWQLGCALILLALLPVQQWKQLHVTDWRQIVVTMVSFAIWVLSLGELPNSTDWPPF